MSKVTLQIQSTFQRSARHFDAMQRLDPSRTSLESRRFGPQQDLWRWLVTNVALMLWFNRYLAEVLFAVPQSQTGPEAELQQHCLEA